ncbi:enolase C-terminal domain-like protein [Halomarina oriensis]|uniref:Mandelate racemase/muconate lactonizing enzyme C-terminal domain-containing protein n=1 Tax=Halomarina oriensis TaxID=671145 RepID=A0A6B0GJM9_9EURY|nr:enolase C-terminal domain-like protein [Halomarina oriensis]MWG35014.1 hypothetical protein [Halomarina oriensis]
MTIRVESADQYVVNLRKRMPFHFGNVVVDEGAHLFLELSVDVDGRATDGIAQAGLAPMWFLKDPDLSLVEGIESLLDVFGTAWEAALDVEANTAFGFWQALYDHQREWAADTDYPPLFWNYGVSLVEQAVVDAVCRANETTFAAAVRDGTLGFDPGLIYDDLAGETPADLLPDDPCRSTALRHTVGLDDPLVDADLAAGDRLDDGLPQTLADYIERDGIDHFKIKLSADVDRDATRLREIRAVVEDRLDDYAFTLDANEQYGSAGTFAEQWATLVDAPGLDGFFDRLRYVEQPLSRDEAFTDEARRVLTDWEGPPVIIDESDARPDSLGRALDCGYAGTSHKNCKGVFVGVANRCLVEYRRQHADGEFVISGEDLTTLGPVELVEDLAVMATIGADDVERNGHHYYRGLSMFPESLQGAVGSEHGDLYRRHDDGFTALAVEEGRIAFGSVTDAPFGRRVTPPFDDEAFVPLDEWDPASVRA